MMNDKDERRLWRGKVHVCVRYNSLGEREFAAWFKLRWWMDWESVPSVANEDHTGRLIASRTRFDFATMEAAKTAAQLKWNAANLERNEQNARRFGAWRKVWP